MARHKVRATPMMEIHRKNPKTPFLGWGKKQIRKTTTEATSPRLLKYRSCIAGEMSGKSFANLKDVQEHFKSVASACAERARRVGEVV